MARYNAHTAHRPAYRSSAGARQVNYNHGGNGYGYRSPNRLGDGDRARTTYAQRRRNDFRREVASVPSQPPRVRLVDRMTYDDGRDVQVNSSVQGAHGYANTISVNREPISNPRPIFTNVNPEPIPYTTRRIFSNATASQGAQGTQSTATPSHNTQETQETQAGQAPTPAPLESEPKPAHQRQRNRQVRGPIRLVNQAHHPRGNTYRGSDPIKLAVQNPKLRAILAGKRPPRQPKRHDEPVLRMGLRDKSFSGV